jgi:Histidine kinase-, DNA gyrase B-, and HSP90-like ATPase
MKNVKHAASVDLYQYVSALARSNLKVEVCCTELIDNSLDWEASRIEIDIVQGRHLRITDNGKGIEDPSALVRFGGHVPNRTKRGSGIYGVGFKDAALRLGGEAGVVDVTTIRDGETIHVQIKWAELKQSPECMTENRISVPDEPAGTTIKITPLRMRFPEGKDRQALIEQLAYIYSPALKGGAQILIRSGGQTYDLSKHRWRMPDLVEHIDETIEVGHKRARLYAGIVKEGQANTKPGLTYVHGYRVIPVSRREGCGRYDVQRICGFVEVVRGWDRTKNKDNLVDAEDLYEAVEYRLRPLLEKADRAAHSIEMSDAVSQLECALAEALEEPKEKAKRKSPENRTGPVKPKGRGSPHEKAESTQPDGHVRPKKPKRGFKLVFMDGWKSGESVGTYERTSKVHAICLYQDHPWIKRSMVPIDRDRLYFAAMTCVSLGPTGGQPGLFDAREAAALSDAAARLAQLTASDSIRFDGMTLGKAAE